MENNTPPPKPIAPPETAVVQPTVSQPIPPQQPSRFRWLFLALFVLGIFFFIGTYFFISTQSPQVPSTPIVNKTVETQKDMHQLDDDLNSIDTGDVSKDFTQVDQELENL